MCIVLPDDVMQKSLAERSNIAMKQLQRKSILKNLALLPCSNLLRSINKQ